MVAERSVSLRRCMATCAENIRSDNVDMSSLKQRAKRCRLKPKVSKIKLIFFGVNRPLKI